MMRLKKLMFLSVIACLFFGACNNDDDDGVIVVPLRDAGEQAIADDEALRSYLQTHFYNEEDFLNPGPGFDYIVRFDTIAGDNANKTPLIESNLLSTKIITSDEIDYTMYILTIREGVGRQPTFADSAFIKYKGELLNRTVFDANTTVPTWFDLPGYVVRGPQGNLTRAGGTIEGFREAVIEFKEASGFVVNEDNTITWNDDFGIGAVFFPSGLGYFASPPGGAQIPIYSPLVFSFNLMRAVEADHDNDGIPSWMEDLNGDGNLFNVDTDGDGFPNHSDADDDGDGTPTRQEIRILEDGTIEFPDTNGNGTPNYLDPDSFEIIE